MISPLKNNSRMILAACTLATGSLALAAGCSEGTAPAIEPGFALAFRVDNPALANGAASASIVNGGTIPTVSVVAGGIRIARDSDIVVVSKAQLVVRDVKLRKTDATCDDDDSENSNHRDRDYCPSVRIGPFLVDLPVSGDVPAALAVQIPEGNYKSVSMWLRPVSSGRSDELTFRQDHPDFRGISARLEGTYNGKPFTFIADVDARIDVPLTTPLVVGATGDKVTVAIDLAGWFARPAKGLYSPAEANTPGLTRAVVMHNIRVAFRAFRDRNHDGKPD